MKRIIFFIFSLIIFYNASAQKIKIKKEIVYVDKAEYCKTDCHGILVDDCKILSLADEVLATINFHLLRSNEGEVIVCEIIFSNSPFLKKQDYRAQVKMEQFKYRHQIIKELYQYKVIQFGQLEEYGLQNFVNAFSIDYIRQYTSSAEEDTLANKKNYGYQIVERDISKNIVFFGNMIQQDLRDIGTYQLEFFTKDDVKKQKIKFFLNDGTLVATAIMDRFSEDNQCELTTTKDNVTKTTTVSGQYSDQRIRSIALHLIQNYYL